jgi:3-dehydroquinate dehydratase
MNRTLLLILCDFLLLTLLALTDWEKAAPAEAPPPPAATPATGAGVATKDDDIVSVMKLSLEDEAARRDELARQLESTQGTLGEKEKALAETRGRADALALQYTKAAAYAQSTKEDLARIQRELDQRRAEAEVRARELATLEKANTEARSKIEDLSVTVRVAEQEKQQLRATTETLKVQVEAERLERLKVQETATQLAQGVGQLADTSVALTREIRENRPVNVNILFNEFLENRVRTVFTGTRPNLFGTRSETKDTRTIFVTDGRDTYALLHINDTPFGALGDVNWNWNTLRAEFRQDGGYRGEAPRLVFLALDPRVAVLPVAPAQLAGLGVKSYPIALEPFKFAEALIIANGGTGYGEIPFKLDPANPGYVRMDNRLVRRLFGDFSPGRGDLVLSKTGELLGIMVNSEYCALVTNFLPSQVIVTGDDLASRPTAAQLDELTSRLRRLPLRIQQ